jgi:hypothetical protein
VSDFQFFSPVCKKFASLKTRIAGSLRVVIQRILGHENRWATEIYLHSMGDSERDAIRVFEQADKNPHTIPTQATNQNKKGLAAFS